MRRAFASLFLRATGWRPEGPRPAARRYVLIAAPHTSNWDLAYLLAIAAHYDVSVSWMGKDSLFRGPWGAVLSRLGGIPVDRTHRGNLVRQMSDLFEQRERLALTVPAEGTRAYTPHWRSGFYHIARMANVPVVLGYLDYQRKRAIRYLGEAAVQGLISGVSTSSYIPTRRKAALLLGELGSKAQEALPVLKSKQHDPDPEVRQAAHNAIAIIERACPS
jgi:hypothetical protein